MKAVLRFQIIGTYFTAILSVSSLSAQSISSLKASILDSRIAEIEANLDANNWKALKDLLNEIKSKNANIATCDLESPLRILYGHAALATGENSKAVEHFYCALDTNNSTTLIAWQTWTKKLVEHRSKSASAHYLYGDALARIGNLEDAKQEFDKCLGIDPNHFLSLNARGVVKWLLFEADTLHDDYELEAIQDLIDATKVSPNFADALANRGVIGLRDRSDLNLAIEKFSKALTIDSQYWLALNGKAVGLGASGKYWDFQKDIAIIESNSPNTPFLHLNTGRTSFFDNRNRGFEGSIGAKFTMPTWKPLGILETKFDLQWSQKRGGIFMYLKEGENLFIDKNNNPRAVGTWFALNYPPQQAKALIDK